MGTFYTPQGIPVPDHSEDAVIPVHLSEAFGVTDHLIRSKAGGALEASAYAAETASRLDSQMASLTSQVASSEASTAEAIAGLTAKVEAATATDAAVATDKTVAVLVDDRATETSAALSRNFIQDGDGVWRADKNGFEKIPTPSSNIPADAARARRNTLLWINLRNKVIQAGGGVIEFGAGLYEFESMPFDADIPGVVPAKINELNVTVQGTAGYGTAIRLTGTFYGGAAVPIGRKAYGEGSIRNVTIRDISLLHNAKWGYPDRAPFQGVRVEMAAAIIFENVRIAGFGRGGFYAENMWDSRLHNLEIMYCGTANKTGAPTDEAPYNSYAVEFVGTGVGSTNAVHVDALRIEQAPLMLKVGPQARLLDFSDCKFEHGHHDLTLNQTASLSPIQLDGALEVSFTGCKFTASQTVTQQGGTPKPFVRSLPVMAESFTKFGYRSSVKFSACHFFANSQTDQNWFAGDDTVFTACDFSRARGQNHPFRLGNFNTFDGCTISTMNSYQRFFTVEGKGNRIKNCTLRPGEGEPVNAIFEWGVAASENDISGVSVVSAMAPKAWVSGASNDGIGSNRVNLASRRVVQTHAGGGSDSVFGAEVVALPQVADTNWTGFNHGWDGQRILVISRASNTRLQQGARLKNRGGASLTLGAGESVSYTHFDGAWYQN